jgi:hypothetical protein
MYSEWNRQVSGTPNSSNNYIYTFKTTTTP